MDKELMKSFVFYCLMIINKHLIKILVRDNEKFNKYQGVLKSLQ